jgi:ribosomal protein S18 acetylase RimI-like enzyme
MPDPRPSTRIAVGEDRASIERSLGAAFVDDPVWTWLIGQRRITERRAGRLLAAIAVAHMRDGLTSVSESCESVAVWAAPERYRIPPRELLPNLPLTVGSLGLRGMARLARIADMERLHPSEPHYYLAILGTLPDAQGRGLAGAVLAPTLARADEEAIGCYLESSKEANLAFYARHGFEVTGEYDVAGGKGPRVWLMWRHPRPS